MSQLQDTRDTLAEALRLLDRIDDVRLFSGYDSNGLPSAIRKDVQTFVMRHPKARWPR